MTRYFPFTHAVPCIRAFALAALMIVLLVPSRATAQKLEYLHGLAVPPSGVGTCAPMAARPRPNGAVQTGHRLIMTNRSPSQHREMQVIVDGAGRVTLYSEFSTASTGPRSNEGDNIIAAFDVNGAVKGTRTHQQFEVPVGTVLPLDTARLRSMVLHAAQEAHPAMLDGADQSRVRLLAAWLRKRCGS